MATLWEFDTDTDILKDETTDTEQTRMYGLVLYNDDVNTFDYVIEVLMEICGHTFEQADQCAHIVHYCGKCTVKTGSYRKLVPMRQALCDRHLSAEVEPL
ncbi:MAG: ATP-dependent Clp protease adaptor ClpS [Cytophagales bacterium]|nr:ATP-dependent Clp protease adaptor ClpS [Cytophagales bacterium]MDW8383876.1 ATP-dependent Clp protease adaptor ClpS [Flammeovirgaceae bacterium]